MRSLASAMAVIALSVFLAPSGALAEKWGNSGKGQGKGNDRHESRHENRQEEFRPESNRQESGRSNDGLRVEFHFGDQDRRVVRDYYGAQAKGGKCPPGLAKKGNGCMPPGQAKKWIMGRPLPRDVVFYDLPHNLVVRLPPPPAGHRYVQVAGDVLMIAVGTSMVVDAIQDILR